ncbi:MAG: glycosyltransferase family 4 protein [Parcubacteria group bacterium]
MKIAFIGQKGIPMTFGGVEKHVERLAVGLADKGHQVFAYTRPWYTPGSKKSYLGVKLISLGSIKTKSLDTITHTFLATIDAMKRDYDIIHYHGVGPSLVAWIPKLFKPSTKVVITFHSIDRYHQKWGLIGRMALYVGERFSVYFSDETITVSKVLQMYCAEKLGADTIYIPNGVDIPELVAPSLIKKKFGLEKDGYILFLSRLVRHKGAHYLIDAYKQLKTSKKLVIAGASAFTEKYVASLKKLVGDNKNIIFTGSVQGGDKLWRELYSNAYLFAHPSESEGLPIVVLEAMSFGRTVLCSDIPENMEAIAGGHGFAFENMNCKDLKKKLEYLLSRPELVKKVGERARDYVAKNYAWGDIVNSVEKVYEQVLARKAVEVATRPLKFKQSVR